MTLRTTTALAVPAIAMLLLAGCTGGPGGGTAPSESAGTSAGSDQTVDEACTELRTGLDELSAVDGTALQSDLVNDPEAAIATMDEVESAIVAATTAVTNPELEPSAEEAADAATSFFDQARAAAQDPTTADPVTLQAGLSTLASAVGELQAACEG
ncbi:hypothetical protein [Agromyces bracchium]|uniref:Secreted protein n=1 Tax=Agromyces bracchium TaxID=88376 RepID=A0A6I3M0Y7_9MICO|nr:hypothetical protein [Agromyces bracchium]MTH67199.1 hypothetical protein [Agromyces bracchium]